MHVNAHRRVSSLFKMNTVVQCAVSLVSSGDCAHFKTRLPSSPIFPLIQPEQLIIPLHLPPIPPKPPPGQKLLSSPFAFLFVLTPSHLRLQMSLFVSRRTSPVFRRPRNTSAFVSDAGLSQTSASHRFGVYFVSHFHPFNAAIQS